MGERELLYRTLKYLFRFTLQDAVGFYLLFAQFTVESFLPACFLTFECVENSVVHLGRCDVTPILAAHLLHHDKKIDPVQERIGEFVLVALDLHLAAAARFALGEQVAARTGVLCCYEHDICLILDLRIDPGDMYSPVLQGLPQCVKDLLAEVGQFVEEEDPLMRQGHLTDLCLYRTSCNLQKIIGEIIVKIPLSIRFSTLISKTSIIDTANRYLNTKYNASNI